jgi:hypothetical protein
VGIFVYFGLACGLPEMCDNNIERSAESGENKYE